MPETKWDVAKATLRQIISHCEEQQRRQPGEALVSYVVRGKWGKATTKRLLVTHGPSGQIVGEMQGKRGPECVCLFKASAVITWARARLAELEDPVAAYRQQNPNREADRDA